MDVSGLFAVVRSMRLDAVLLSLTQCEASDCQRGVLCVCVCARAVVTQPAPTVNVWRNIALVWCACACGEFVSTCTRALTQTNTHQSALLLSRFDTLHVYRTSHN